MENFLKYFPVKPGGGTLVVAVPLPLDQPLQIVAAADIADTAAVALAAPEKYIGRELDLVGDVLDVTGRPAKPVSIPLEALAQGWPQGMSLYRWLGEPGKQQGSPDCVRSSARLRRSGHGLNGCSRRRCIRQTVPLRHKHDEHHGPPQRSNGNAIGRIGAASAPRSFSDPPMNANS